MIATLNSSKYLFEVSKQLNFTDQQTAILSDYPDQLLQLAYTATQKAAPNNKFSYFEVICKRQVDRFKVKKEVVKDRTAPWLPPGINPWKHKTYEENLQRWEQYISSGECRMYLEHFGEDALNNQRIRFIRELDLLQLSHSKEVVVVQEEGFLRKETACQIVEEIKKIQKLSENPNIYGGKGYGDRIIWNLVQKDYIPAVDESEALMFIDKIRIRVGLEPRMLVEFNPQSTTLNETTQERLNTQENNLRLNTVKIERVPETREFTPEVLKRLESFRGTPNYKDIENYYFSIYGKSDIHIATKEPELKLRSPPDTRDMQINYAESSYNPFDELEIINDAVLL